MLIELAREAIGGRKVSASTYARALRAFGEETLIKLTALIGTYAMTAIALCIVDQHLHEGMEPLLRKP